MKSIYERIRQLLKAVIARLVSRNRVLKEQIPDPDIKDFSTTEPVIDIPTKVHHEGQESPALLEPQPEITEHQRPKDKTYLTTKNIITKNTDREESETPTKTSTEQAADRDTENDLIPTDVPTDPHNGDREITIQPQSNPQLEATDVKGSEKQTTTEPEANNIYEGTHNDDHETSTTLESQLEPTEPKVSDKQHTHKENLTKKTNQMDKDEQDSKPFQSKNPRDRKTSKEQTHTKQPRNIGGRRKLSPQITNSDSEDSSTKRIYQYRPTLICREVDGQWEIFLSVPEEYELVKVLQEDKKLPIENNECKLEKLSGHITIVKKEGEREKLHLAGRDKPLVFKTSKDWSGDGRQIKRITKGYFFVIAPIQWVSNEEASIEPEECQDSNYQVHFLCRDNETNTDTPVFNEYEDLYSNTGFQLSGRILLDNSDHGDLYIQTPPELQVGSNIAWIRVGEEPSDKHQLDRWDENFEPNKKTLAEVMNGREGRYYIRVYDKECHLVDSDQFRYLSNLKEIKLNGISYVPDNYILPSKSNGHTPATIEFISTDDRPLDPEFDEGLGIANKRGVMTFETISYKNDRTTWKLRSKTGEVVVEIVLVLPRLWWRLGQQQEEGLWYDKPISMTREQFLEYAGSDTRLFIRPVEIGTVKCGVQPHMDQTHPIKDGLPLVSFKDYTELQTPLSKAIEFGISLNEKLLTLVSIKADQLPRLNQVPYAYVKKGKGYLREDNYLRQGRGFSSGELISAGLSPLNTLGLTYDKRRQTSYQFNVDKIKDWRQQCLETKI